MPNPVSALADRAVHAADAVRDLVDEAQEVAARIAPPIEIHALAFVLGRWAERLREVDQPDQPEPGQGGPTSGGAR
jgi:hypothetical protein